MAEFVYTNDIKQIFPWYSDIKRQNRYHPDRTDCYQLVGFLPFVVSFKIAGLGLVPTQWGIYDEKDTLKVNLTSKLSLIHTYYSSSPDADGFYSVWGIYFGDYLGIDIPCG